ncbi:MAG: hypothetical protein CMH22_05170 [Methylophaga sp.]|nr:hypothetical protein [Methylophaga sp.]MAX51348.1 hypothetical protein [Methylophaga sp.]
MNTNAQEALKEYREKIRTGEIEKPPQKTPLDRHLEDKTSKAKAIVAFCFQCIYDPAEKGSWKTQVRNCPCTDCPLWNVRPK